MNSSSGHIALVPISDILNSQFFVPSFQRGYRWTRPEVEALLDDVYEFATQHERSEKSVFYCLQPLIVFREGELLHVIDGQQRLTTLHIILTHLKVFAEMLGKGRYSLSYETRPDSEAYLQNIDVSRAEENVDYYHINEAFQAIQEWFANKDGSVKLKILNTLTANDTEGRNVKFIWYEIAPEDAIDVFTRINIGKIPLTDAELIKALLLRGRNYAQGETARQLSIATEWDEIEKKLSNPQFWYFLSNATTQYENKIELVLDLVSEKGRDSKKQHSFFYFDKLIEEERKASAENGTFNIDTVWSKVKEQFQTLEEWFYDHKLYHYVGYLLAIGRPLPELLKLAKGKSKSAFIEIIQKEIKKQFQNTDIEELSFGQDKTKIKNILLLYNLETLLRTEKMYFHFPFDLFKQDKWDIEHINPQKSFDKIESYKIWCCDILMFLTGMEVETEQLSRSHEDFEETYAELCACLIEDKSQGHLDSIIDILNDYKNYKSKVEELAQELFDEYKIRGRAEEDLEGDAISNLTLLDAATNRSYGNSIFPVKRNRVIQNDETGIFVPLCTKNVFLKYYSKKLNNVLHWDSADAQDYLNNIKAVLAPFLPAPKEQNL